VARFSEDTFIRKWEAFSISLLHWRVLHDVVPAIPSKTCDQLRRMPKRDAADGQSPIGVPSAMIVVPYHDQVGKIEPHAVLLSTKAFGEVTLFCLRSGYSRQISAVPGNSRLLAMPWGDLAKCFPSLPCGSLRI